MGVLGDRERGKVKELLGTLEQPVTMVNFSQALECPTCRDTRRLIEEVGELSDKLSVELYDLVADKDKAELYGIDKIPATVLTAGHNRRVRYFGMPAGYELPTLLEDIRMLSSGDSGLSPESRDKLRVIKEPVHLQVFVTPT